MARPVSDDVKQLTELMVTLTAIYHLTGIDIPALNIDDE